MIASTIDTFNTLYLGIAAFTALIVFFVGSYSAFIRLKDGKNSVDRKALSDSNTALGTLVASLKLQLTAAETANKLLTENNDTLKGRVTALENTVTQAPQISELIQQQGKQHKEIMGGISKLIGAINKQERSHGKRV
jgi:ABC-type transporter Mla subunit MlaD